MIRTFEICHILTYVPASYVVAISQNGMVVMNLSCHRHLLVVSGSYHSNCQFLNCLLPAAGDPGKSGTSTSNVRGILAREQGPTGAGASAWHSGLSECGARNPGDKLWVSNFSSDPSNAVLLRCFTTALAPAHY